MSMSPDEGEDILAFGNTETPARGLGGARKRLWVGATGGAGLAGAAIAVGLLAFGGGAAAAPAAHHQDSVLTQRMVDMSGAQTAYSSELVISETGQMTAVLPARSGRVVKLDASTGRPTCPNP